MRPSSRSLIARVRPIAQRPGEPRRTGATSYRSARTLAGATALRPDGCSTTTARSTTPRPCTARGWCASAKRTTSRCPARRSPPAGALPKAWYGPTRTSPASTSTTGPSTRRSSRTRSRSFSATCFWRPHRPAPAPRPRPKAADRNHDPITNPRQKVDACPSRTTRPSSGRWCAGVLGPRLRTPGSSTSSPPRTSASSTRCTRRCVVASRCGSSRGRSEPRSPTSASRARRT